MTSSDVIDTCLNIQLKQSGEILLSGLDSLLKSLKARAIEHKTTICMGRSHGIHAEPTTFGLKMLRHMKSLIEIEIGCFLLLMRLVHVQFLDLLEHLQMSIHLLRIMSQN